MATSKLKLSLTGHISTVRGLVVSPRHPYLFSCAEDKTVKCWDLEYNKVTAIIQVEKHNSEKKKKSIHFYLIMLKRCQNVKNVIRAMI